MSNQSNMPAFPAMDMNSHQGIDRMELRYEGLTKREYFAGLAMQSLAAGWRFASHSERIAKDAVIIADALLEELEKH